MAGIDAINPCGESDMYCLTCSHAQSDPECRARGSYVKCEPQSMCYRLEKVLSSTETRISRGCRLISQCPPEGMGSGNQYCSKPEGQAIDTQCLTCSYFQETEEKNKKKPYLHCGDIETGRCRCFGDPHCYRFDMEDKDKDMFVVGSCVRTLVHDYCPWEKKANHFPTVHITATFQRKKAKSPRSFVKDVTINMLNMDYSYSIYLQQGSIVSLVNYDTEFEIESLDEYPYINENEFPGLVLEKSDNLLIAQLPNNMMVEWDGVKTVEIIVPKNTMGSLCGLCGNFDGDPSNDFVIGHNTNRQQICPAKMVTIKDSGRQAPDAQTFADSWIENVNDDMYCKMECGIGTG